MPMSHEHLLRSSIPAVRHDDSQARSIRFRLVTQPRPANAVLRVEVLLPWTVCVKLPRDNETCKLSSACWKSRSGTMIAEDVAPEDAGSSAVVTEENQRVRERDEPFFDRGS